MLKIEIYMKPDDESVGFIGAESATIVAKTRFSLKDPMPDNILELNVEAYRTYLLQMREEVIRNNGKERTV